MPVVEGYSAGMQNVKSSLDVQSFAKAVHKQAKREGTAELFVNAAIGRAATENWADPKERGRIEACCFMATEIAEASAAADDRSEPVDLEGAERKKSRKGVFGSSSTSLPEILVTSEVLRKYLEPEVEQLRKSLFGNASLPFKSIEEARCWIEQEAKDGETASRAVARKKLLDAQAAANQRFFRLASEAGWALEKQPVSIKLGVLFYPGRKAPSGGKKGEEPPLPDAAGKPVPVPAGSRLVELAALSKSAAHRTGFSEAAITAHLLTGVPIVLSRLDLDGTTYLGCPRPTEYTVTVRAHNPTMGDFRAAFKRFFKKRGRVVRVQELDWKLYQEVQRRGGEPITNKGKWWDETAGAIGLKGEKRGDAARMRWRRLPAKLKGLPIEKLAGTWIKKKEETAEAGEIIA